MIYRFSIEQLPTLRQLYQVTRKTVWQIADPFHILLYIKDGCCEITTDGRTCLLRPGDLFLIPANQIYTRRPVKDQMCTLLYLHFSTAEVVQAQTVAEARYAVEKAKQAMDLSILSDGRSAPGDCTVYTEEHLAFGPDDQLVAPHLRNARKHWITNHLESRMAASLELCQVLSAATQATLSQLFEKEKLVLESAVPQKLKKALIYIKMNYTRPITLEDLCNHCSVSKQQMIRYFKAEFGTTPTAYILAFKINRAKQYFLTSSHLSVKEVAAELGFDDPLYFSRVFSRLCGEAPTHYRYRVTHYPTNPKDTNS